MSSKTATERFRVPFSVHSAACVILPNHHSVGSSFCGSLFCLLVLSSLPSCSFNCQSSSQVKDFDRIRRPSVFIYCRNAYILLPEELSESPLWYCAEASMAAEVVFYVIRSVIVSVCRICGFSLFFEIDTIFFRSGSSAFHFTSSLPSSYTATSGAGNSTVLFSGIRTRWCCP